MEALEEKKIMIGRTKINYLICNFGLERQDVDSSMTIEDVKVLRCAIKQRNFAIKEAF